MDRQTETAATDYDHDRRHQQPPLEKADFLNDRPCHSGFPDQTTPRACTLMRTAPSISDATPLLEVYDTFDKYPDLIALPVVHGDKPVGLINRHTLYELFSKPFTRDLHGRKPIRHFMVTDPIIVDKQVSLDDLAQIIISAGMQHMYNGFIITDKERYVGIGNGHDLLSAVTERKQAHLYHLAHFDALTELPNRLLFRDRLLQACARAQRNGHKIALLFLDLDRFKLINDTLGHGVGDLLLKKVAERLRRLLRENDTVARLGGDEFTIILDDMQHMQDVAVVAQKLLECIARPFVLEEHEVVVTTSIGVALFPTDAADIEALQKHADAAMYHAKEIGKNNYQFFTAHMNELVSSRLSLENGLRRALDEGQLFLHYQPQMALNTRRIVGLEALLRWQHPQRGLVPPLEFIPLAEELGLMDSIGKFVLLEACRQQRRWYTEHGISLRMAVNLASWQLEQPDFTDTVARILHETGMPPEYLELELTENVLMKNLQQALVTLNKLGKMGIRFAVDDFGTGYSSLSYLLNLPIDTLKIDRCFIQSIGQKEDGATITKAVIALARSLKLNVVAEGVENKEQLKFLKQQGCDYGQGYYFCKPKAPEELTEFLVGAVSHLAVIFRASPPSFLTSSICKKP